MIDLGRHRKLIHLLDCPPAGESRLLYFHARKGKAGKVKEYLEGHFSKQGVALDSQELLERGLFGTGKAFPEAVRRLGDLVLIPKKNHAFSFPYLDSRAAVGRHGGLSREEMLVPLLWKRV